MVNEIQLEISQHWAAFWVMLFLGWITVYVAWRRGFFKPFHVSSKPIVTGWEVIKGFVLFMLSEMVIVPVSALAIIVLYNYIVGISVPVDKLIEKDNGWINCASILGGFIALFIVYRTIPKERRIEIIEQQPGRRVTDFMRGVATWFVAFPVVMAISQLISIVLLHIFHQSLADQNVMIYLRSLMKHPMLFTVTALEIVILIPLMEEFLFRGLLQSWLKRKTGKASWAVLITSVIFATFHFGASQGIANLELLPTLFMLSCFLGFIYERQRSLWASYGLHAFFNGVSVLGTISLQ